VSEQFALFEGLSPEPDGLRYTAAFVSTAVERKLISTIKDLPLQPFQFGQFEGKRRIASFGFRYDYALRRLEVAEPIPSWLAELIEQVENLAELPHRFGKLCALNMTSGLALVGTATSRISTRYLASR
jgi:hypothetical protein